MGEKARGELLWGGEERLWTQTKMNMALGDWPLSADLWRLRSKSAAAARQKEECLVGGCFFAFAE